VSVAQPSRLRPYRGVQDVEDFLTRCDKEQMPMELKPEQYRGFLIWLDPYMVKATGLQGSRLGLAAPSNGAVSSSARCG
jgi:hypothetical protein